MYVKFARLVLWNILLKNRCNITTELNNISDDEWIYIYNIYIYHN